MIHIMYVKNNFIELLNKQKKKIKKHNLDSVM